jgi:hypothetical protein
MLNSIEQRQRGCPPQSPNYKHHSRFHAIPPINVSQLHALGCRPNTLDVQSGFIISESTGPLYDTLGTRDPTALNQSEFATGLQQTAFNIFAESAFDCPSYWLADAFSSEASNGISDQGKESWKYQYSVTPAYHGADLTAYFSVGASVPNAGFRDAFQRILGNFIINDTPVISTTDAKGGMANSTVPEGTNGDIDWPRWNADAPVLMNLNTTGGTLIRQTVTDHLAYWLREGSGTTNEFGLTDARAWEGGRGERCEFWQRVGSRVPQ